MNLEEYIRRAQQRQEEEIHKIPPPPDGGSASPPPKDGVMVLDNRFLSRNFRPSDILINAHIPFFNRSPQPHKHDFFELVYVVRGSMKNVVDGRRILLEQGDFCLMNPNAVHQVETDGKDPLAINFLMKKELFNKAFLSIVLENELFANFFVDSIYHKKNKQNYLVFSARHLEEPIISQYLLQIFREYENDQLYSQRVIESAMSCLFVEFTRSYKRELEFESLQDLPGGNISKIISYLSENYRTATLQTTAKQFNYHPKYLPNLLKKYLGQSFSEIVQQFRLAHACELLKQTELPISDVAQESGYTNRTYFYKVFQQKFGMSPNDYRHQNQAPGPHSIS